MHKFFGAGRVWLAQTVRLFCMAASTVLSKADIQSQICKTAVYY